MIHLVTVESGPVVHHANLKKIAHIRHEAGENRATLFLVGGNEFVVVFPDRQALATFVQQWKMANM